MTINEYPLPVNYEAEPTGMRAEKDSLTPSTSCSTETLESFLAGDNAHAAGEVNNASFVDLDGLLDEDLLDDDDDDDDDNEDDDNISEGELTGKQEEKATYKKKRKVGRIVKVRASDFCHPDGGKIDPKQFEQVVKHLKSQKLGKGGIDKVPKIVVRPSSTDIDSCSGPMRMRRANSNLRSIVRRRRAESQKQVHEDVPGEVKTKRRKPPRKISSISLDSFKSVLRAGIATSKKTSKASTETDENDQDDLSKSPASNPRILQRIASSPGSKSSRWGSGSDDSQAAKKQQGASSPPSRPARTTTSPGRSNSFAVRPSRGGVNPPPLVVSDCSPGTKKLTLFEREQAIRDAGITPAMIEKLRRVGLYISDTP